MNKTKRKIAILALMAIFTFSWGAAYIPVRADDGGVTAGSPGDPSDGDGGKSTAGKGTKPPPPPPTTKPDDSKSWIQILMDLLW